LLNRNLLLQKYEDVIRAWHRVVILSSSKRLKNWTLPRGLPQRATRNLESMERLAKNKNKNVFQKKITDTNSESSSIIVNDDNGLPSVDTYNLILELWSESDELHYSSVAESIFRRAFGSSSKIKSESVWNDSSQTWGMRPTAKTFRIMIRAWLGIKHHNNTNITDSDGDNSDKQVEQRTKSGSAMFNATGYLLRMQELLGFGLKEFEPSIDDYLILLEIWGQVLYIFHSLIIVSSLQYLL